MADLENVDGYLFVFPTSSVVAIADHDPDTGDAVTTVYGIAAGRERIVESVSRFLIRLGIQANFAELTQPSGRKILINGTAVSLLRMVLPGEYPASIRSVITGQNFVQGVEEDVPAARGLLNARGANL